MLRPDYPIATERLLLRPITPEDAVALHAYQSREDVCRYVPYHPRSLAELESRLASPEARRSTLDEPGQAMLLAAVRRDDSALAGDLMLAWTSREHGTGEIGYAFDPAQRYFGSASTVWGCTGSSPVLTPATIRRPRCCGASACVRRRTSSRTSGSRTSGPTSSTSRSSRPSGVLRQPARQGA